MRYFVDYDRTCVFRQSEEGVAWGKLYDYDKRTGSEERCLGKVPLYGPGSVILHEENGMGNLNPEISEKEYNEFGITWAINPCGLVRVSLI